MSNMPTIGEYKGVALHAFQAQERIDSVVKPAIDHVYTVDDPDELQDYMCSSAKPPEARILASARYAALSERAADKRLPRPALDPRQIRAAVAGLASHWASPSHYCRLFDDYQQAAPRPPEFGEQLSRYFSEAMRTRAAG